MGGQPVAMARQVAIGGQVNRFVLRYGHCSTMDRDAAMGNHSDNGEFGFWKRNSAGWFVLGAMTAILVTVFVL